MGGIRTDDSTRPLPSASGWGRETHRIFVGLGSNLGDRRGQLDRAVAWLTAHPAIRLGRVTPYVETAPWGGVEQPAYLNAVASAWTTLAPGELLVEIKGAEKALGRRDRGERWGPREIDIDILLYGDLVCCDAQLSLPHPQLHRRDFVLIPLLELDPALVHPRSRRPLSTYRCWSRRAD